MSHGDAVTPLDPFPPPTVETFLLVVAAVGLRLVGIRLRGTDRVLVRSAGWIASSFAPWLAASLFGAWSPLWVALAGGLAALAPATWIDERRVWIPAVDTAILALAFGLSVGGPTTAAALLVAALLVAGLAVFDAVVRRLGRPSRVVVLLGLAPAVVFVAHLASFAHDPLVPPTRFPLHVGLVPRCFGLAVELPGGARAWLDLPGPAETRVGAVLYHGANRLGSRQPAACAIRRALQEAGLPVIALDHPGFGASAAPAVDGPIEDWEYLPAARLAAEWLVAQGLAERIILVGHSMGTSSVLRLATDPPPEALAGIVLGAALREEGADPGDRAYRRFHSDRRLAARLDRDRWLEIRRRYYNLRGVVASLREGGLPIAAGFFTVDWPNIREGRGELLAELPEPKRRFDVPSSHYLSSNLTRRLLVGDPRGARSLARTVRAVAAEGGP